MSQERIMQLLSRELAGEITTAELHELHELKSRFPDTVYYEELIKQVWTSSVKEEDVSLQYLQHKEKYFDVKPLNKERDFNLIKRNTIKISFAALIVVAFILLAKYKWGENLWSNNVKVIAEKGIRKNIILPDGTNVWLNSESELTYNEDIATSPIRKILLKGEAFFDVRHSKKRPFVIATNHLSINVLGTAFNVKAYENEKQTETSLVRGSIELSLNKEPNKKILLKPSEKFIYNEEEPAEVNDTKINLKSENKIEHLEPVLISNNKYIKEISWTNNLLLFKNESLEELVPKLERWYNVEIVIKNPKIKEYRFTGAFSRETIEEALLAMKLIKNYEFKINANEIELY